MLEENRRHHDADRRHTLCDSISRLSDCSKVVIAGPMEEYLSWLGRFANIVPLFFAIGALGWLTLLELQEPGHGDQRTGIC